MEQHAITISGTADFRILSFDQYSSAETESHYKDILDDLADLPSIILPEKKYRVLAGQLYVVRPGSPPIPEP